MRARNIKPGFFKNELLAELTFEQRLFFIGLWTVADREGRVEYRPRRLKADLFPYDEIDIDDAVAELSERGFVSVYEIDGLRLIQISNWSKHQNPHHKEVGSVLPALPSHVDRVCKGYIPLSNTIRHRIYQRDGRVCKSCGATHGLSIDHIVPISKGGNSNDDNLQVLCLGCNVRKGNRISMDEPCMTQARVMDESSKSPVVPLIPDSLNLIPDSLLEPATAGLFPADAGNDQATGVGEQPQGRPPCPQQQIVDLYHQVLPELRRMREWNETRRRLLARRWSESRERQNLDWWAAFFGYVRRSTFLMGRTTGRDGRPFDCDLEWLIRPNNFAKVVEGKYEDQAA